VAIPPQSIVPGQFENIFAREQDLLLRERVVERLWAKDLSLWPNHEFDRERIASNLRWLDLPDSLEPLLRVVAQEELSAKDDGLEYRALLALENANLCARALLGFPRFVPAIFLVFDTMCPFTIRRLESRFDLRKTLFFLANKTTYQLEDHCLFLYFLNRLYESQVQRPAQHFISQTQPGTFLVALTGGHEFRLALDVPAGILATYTSALTFAPLPETFKWELASVLACARLGLDPFDWPETREPRSLAMNTLDKPSARDGALRRTPRVKDSAIQLFAEGKTRIELSTVNLVEALHTFVRLSTPDSFLVYLDRAPSVSAILRELSRKLMESLPIPVLTAFGPHSTEYYGHHFRPGFPKGLYVALTAGRLSR
jgi:hypothetical protein